MLGHIGVDGIPLAIIERKKPDVGPGKDPIAQAISRSQHIRNQKDDGIPHLFFYSRLLLAADCARLGTTETSEKFWSLKESALPSR